MAACHCIIIEAPALDQWGYLLLLFQGDFHSGQGIKHSPDSSLVPNHRPACPTQPPTPSPCTRTPKHAHGGMSKCQHTFTPNKQLTLSCRQVRQTKWHLTIGFDCFEKKCDFTVEWKIMYITHQGWRCCCLHCVKLYSMPDTVYCIPLNVMYQTKCS